MKKKFVVAAAATVVAVAVAGIVAVTTGASAAVLPPMPGEVTFLSGPRVASSPGTPINANQTVPIQIGGKTFGSTAIPANATGVVLTVTSNQPQAAGIIRVWTTDAGMPGTPAVTFGKGQQVTNTVTVALNDAGKFNLWSNVRTYALVIINAYVAPETPAAAPVVKTIAAKPATKLNQVGGSIRGDKANNLKGATEFGSVVLPKGTWDARVIGGMVGLNNGNKTCTTGDEFLTGTMILVKDYDGTSDTDTNRYFDFSQVATTVGGVVVPESNSASLTQDPTLNASTFITLGADTKLSVLLFGYASNSSTDCTGVLEGVLTSAEFRKVA